MNLIVQYVVQTCDTIVQAQCVSQLLLLQNKIMVDYIGI